MKRPYIVYLLALVLFVGLSACATKKKKSSRLKLPGRVYHNLTAHYNGYFNANELYKQAVEGLQDGYAENYNQILPLYPEVASDQAESVGEEVKAIVEKLAVVIKLHRPSDWTDDGYLLLGKARHLEKDYEAAEEAFEYLMAEYGEKGLKQKKLARKSKKNRAKIKKKERAKAKKRQKKEDFEEQPDKYPLEKRPAYEEGQIWLARTYIDRQRYDDAESILYLVEKDEKTHKRLFDDIAEVKAYSKLKQGEYVAALPYLEQAYELTNSKRKRGRYAFIMAQINQTDGNNAVAMEYFRKVLKSTPEYEMAFNAKLNLALSAWQAGEKGSGTMAKELRRMLRDGKNKEYKDRIYYVLGQVYLKEGQTAEAIEALRQSVYNNQNNPVQKAESYLLLADLYFEGEAYVHAKHYYDSTLAILPESDERLERVRSMSDNLVEIAKNMEIIQLQDSLLGIYAMTEQEKRLLAAELFKKQQAEEAAAPSVSKTSGSVTNDLGASKSSFFAYNDRSMKRGRKNFGKRWGTRTLEDDWRRSKRPGAGLFNEDAAPEDIAENLSEEQVADIFKDVPKTEEEVRAAEDKIKKALFALGVQSRDKIADNALVVSSLERLVTAFPDTEDKLDAYYYLYLAHTDLENQTKAKYYYDKIISEYPNTTFARVLSDPDFLNEASDKEREMVQYYDTTYAMFSEGQVEQAYKRLRAVDGKFGKVNSLTPKFALLTAFSIGKLQGKEAYIKALSGVVAKHGKTEEGKKALEILQYLKNGKLPGKPTASKPAPKDGGKPNPGGKGKENTEKPKEKEQKKPATAYKVEDAKSHYFIAALPDGSDLRTVKDAISDYNRGHFKNKSYRSTNIYLKSGNKAPMVVVRRFRNKDDAMGYLNTVSADKAAFLGEGVDAQLFVISQSNYRTVLKAKDIASYIPFFREHYE